MQIAVKRLCAWGAKDIARGPWHILHMVKVKRDTALRRPTFLRQWREYRGLTLEEAAERLEMHHTSLLRIERGNTACTLDFLEAAALVYGCDAIDFLDNDPRSWNVPRLVYDQLKQASPAKQREAMAIIEAFLKAS